MFEFIQFCITLINMVNTFVNTKYEDWNEQHEAFNKVSEYFYGVVCKTNVYKYEGKQYCLGLYWRYTTEAVYRQACAHFFGKYGGDMYDRSATSSSTTANVWAAKLGYEVVGV